MDNIIQENFESDSDYSDSSESVDDIDYNKINYDNEYFQNNSLQSEYLETRNKLFTKDIVKHRIIIDTHNIKINESLDTSNYTYYLHKLSGQNSKYNYNNTTGYDTYKNVIGFRFIKAIIPNRSYTINNTNNTFIVQLDNQFYNFIGTKENTTDSDPGTGKIKFNQSTIANATQAFISKTNSSSKDISSLLDGNNFLRIENDSGEFIDFNITGVVDNTNYRTLTINTSGLTSTLTNFSEDDQLKVYLLKLNNIEDRGKKIKITLKNGFFNTNNIQQSFASASYEWYNETGGTSANNLNTIYIITPFFENSNLGNPDNFILGNTLGNFNISGQANTRLFTFVMSNNYRFKFIWSSDTENFEDAKVLLGFLIDTPTFTNPIIGETPPDMSIHYFDIVIPEIPYIACKHNTEKKSVIERIPITSAMDELLIYEDTGFNIDDQNYFFPISLEKLTIQLYQKNNKLFDNNNKHHSLEFEITMINKVDLIK